MKTVEELQTELDSVVAKNRELLNELKAAKAKAKGAEIDPEEFAKLQTETEELRATLAKTERTGKTEIERLSKALSDKDGALQNFLIEGGLTEAMVKAGVRPELMPAAKALLKAKASIKEDAGSFTALMGDKPLADAVREWASGDEGKHFVSAPASNGGGAPGGSGGGAGKKFADMSSEERTALYRSNPQQYAALKAAA